MSRVSNVILTYHILEEEDVIDKAVRQLKCGDVQLFESIDSDELPKGWYGGSKMMETRIWLGAINHMLREDIVELINTVPWEYPEYVQVFVKEQEDNLFREYSIVPQSSETLGLSQAQAQLKWFLNEEVFVNLRREDIADAIKKLLSMQFVE